MYGCRAHATSVLHVMHLLMMAPDGLRSRNMLHDTHILAGGQHLHGLQISSAPNAIVYWQSRHALRSRLWPAGLPSNG